MVVVVEIERVAGGAPSDTMEVRTLVVSLLASVPDNSWKAVATG